MTIDQSTFKLGDGCYFEEKIAKSLIVLHFTAGFSASGAVNYWKMQKNGVSTPYILDRNGLIYQTYDPQYWSYHLGFKGTHAHDKRSIPIEIVNIGPLKLKNGILYCWPNNFTTAYCKESETQFYVKKPYRGFDYFASFTPQQMSVLPELVSSVATTYGISKILPPKEKRGEFDIAEFVGWKGIWDHAACRVDKFDLGPAFDWSILENI
jgi:hypothetical protein